MKSKFRNVALAAIPAIASIFLSVQGNLAHGDGRFTQRAAPSLRVLANSDLLLIGRVDRAQVSEPQLSVLGQWVKVPADQIDEINGVLVGSVVEVYGEIAADGSLKVSAVANLS